MLRFPDRFLLWFVWLTLCKTIVFAITTTRGGPTRRIQLCHGIRLRVNNARFLFRGHTRFLYLFHAKQLRTGRLHLGHTHFLTTRVLVNLGGLYRYVRTLVLTGRLRGKKGKQHGGAIRTLFLLYGTRSKVERRLNRRQVFARRNFYYFSLLFIRVRFSRRRHVILYNCNRAKSPPSYPTEGSS